MCSAVRMKFADASCITSQVVVMPPQNETSGWTMSRAPAR